MQARVSKWGESLGGRSQKEAAFRVGLTEGSAVEISVEGDRLVLTPTATRFSLAELLDGVTPEAMREAFEWDAPQGREIL